MQDVWEIFSEELYLTSKYYGLLIHSFVLMNNHFHLIASTPQSNISECMRYFMKNSSDRLTHAGNRINQTYGGRHFKTILQCSNYYLNAYKYNYLNPVIAGITKRAEEYPFSTLRGLLGFHHLLIPMAPDNILFANVEETLKWLNDLPSNEKLKAASYGFKGQYFRKTHCRKTREYLLHEFNTL
ncbi:MAG: transposase [Bdellovibrionales bacterium]|nr:transposase [Bdellovibrionales bacterium]